MNTLTFTKNLVKGRIAETIFSQMLRDAGVFTVLEFGYEKIVPDLLQYNHGHDDPVIETLRTAPDFAIINQVSKEVKYRRQLNASDMKLCAERMHQSWNPSYLFVATLDGFYFDEISTIIKNGGKVTPLEHPQIPPSMQTDYLKILQDFESHN